MRGKQRFWSRECQENGHSVSWAGRLLRAGGAGHSQQEQKKEITLNDFHQQQKNRTVAFKKLKIQRVRKYKRDMIIATVPYHTLK